jgi:hypothetical protein
MLFNLHLKGHVEALETAAKLLVSRFECTGQRKKLHTGKNFPSTARSGVRQHPCTMPCGALTGT